ncbi:hypothetical protein VPNG_05202 [Cytospora leucostoma]|uniref:Xylanolytic transcriptional activator regulatory domain-containing protein n=1 Tax=Cytospora leucostoma TaxID=1230097 RepID=A0A423X7Q8_9PEZI|nr:hypothetical protein VPNG_05202 [Cytospora leucostoma]
MNPLLSPEAIDAFGGRALTFSTLDHQQENQTGVISYMPDNEDENTIALVTPETIVPFDGQTLVIPTIDHLHQPQISMYESPSARLSLHLNPVVCADLDQLYFDRVHMFAPMLLRSRYLRWSKQPDKGRQRQCLQHAMWTLAVSQSSQFQLIRLDLYAETQRLLKDVEGASLGRHYVEEVQARILVSLYELMSTDCDHQQGIVSARKAFHLIQLMRLNVIDDSVGSGLAERQSDWIDIESMRRTFWVAYTIDRTISAFEDSALTFFEHQILTRLPQADAALSSGRSTTMCYLTDILTEQNSERLSESMSSPFTASIVMATICGRALEHKHQSQVVVHYQDSELPLSTLEFFRRHQSLRLGFARHVKMLSAQITSMLDHLEPMLAFAAITAQTAVLMHCEIIETMTFKPGGLGLEVADALLMDHKQRRLEAVHQLSILAARLRQTNHFQTHMLIPIPLVLSAQICLKHFGLDDVFSDYIFDIAAVLEGLGEVNGLASSCLRRLCFE